jgi:S1-C subfamily serine protease
MSDPTNWTFPEEFRPDPDELAFDLDEAIASVVQLRADVPADAFTASVLGTNRTGNGVVIGDDGLVLTIGYLVTEAESVWLTTHDGRVVAGHPLAYDQATGFGLVLPLGPLRLPPRARGRPAAVRVGSDVFVLGAGGREHALKAALISRREFAGYWEYLLEQALFTAPPHPRWSGAPLLDEQGLLIGIGSLFIQESADDETIDGNMFVPTDLLEPILDAMLRTGRPAGPAHPWLGMYASETQGQLVVGGLAKGGPAEAAGVRVGDRVLEVGGERVSALADLFRKVWRLGPPGVEVALTIARDSVVSRMRVRTADRNDFLRKPMLQ